jgi:hypothetical protein
MADVSPTTTTPEIPDRNTPADIVFDMEESLMAAEGYAQATYLAGVGLIDFNKDAAQGVIRLGMELIRTTGELRDAHARLHEALHSDKAEPEKQDAAGLPENPLIGDLLDNMEKNWTPTFKAVCDMEEPLTAVRDYTSLILEIASGDAMDKDVALGVQQLARNMRREIEAAEELRCGIFRANHPNRKHFERDGWPGDKLDEGDRTARSG